MGVRAHGVFDRRDGLHAYPRSFRLLGIVHDWFSSSWEEDEIDCVCGIVSSDQIKDLTIDHYLNLRVIGQ